MANRPETTDTTESKALIVGLGNPGSEYVEHRHNIGFRVVEALAQAHGMSFSRRKDVRAHVAEGQIHGRAVVLAKPRTFMNLSGRAVSRLSRENDISPGCILVVYDDLDLPLGRLRLRPEGGSGGHKGMRSIIDLLGTQDFPRLRVGIDRPVGRVDPADYVLQPFAPEQESPAARVVETAAEAIECWIALGIFAAMEHFNRPFPIVPAVGSPAAAPRAKASDGLALRTPQIPAGNSSWQESSSPEQVAPVSSGSGGGPDPGDLGEEPR